ncbi:MAG: hypothetical protein ABEL97_08870 [Salinibacter sp.]
MIKSYSSSLRAQTFLEEALEELDASEPEAALDRIRHMKRLLLRYHEEQSTLDRLGLDDMDEAVDAMLAMKKRADHLQEQLNAIRDTLDVDASAEETAQTIKSISEQLQSLYEERKLLSRAGVSDATEAVRLIRSMREQLDDAHAETESVTGEQGAPPDRLEQDRLEQEVDGPDSESVLDMIESMEPPLPAEVEPQADDPGASSVDGTPLQGALSTLVRTLERQMRAAQTGETDVPADEVPPLVPAHRLDALTEDAPADLEALDVGVVALDDEAHIRLATEHTPLLPGLEGQPEGDSLFDRCPAVQNPLLRAPLRRGRDTGTLDCRFAFTVPRPDAHVPLPLTLHLYRASGSGPTWLLYDRLR